MPASWTRRTFPCTTGRELSRCSPPQASPPSDVRCSSASIWAPVESTDAEKGFLEPMVARGLRSPLLVLVVSDGAPGLNRHGRARVPEQLASELCHPLPSEHPREGARRAPQARPALHVHRTHPRRDPPEDQGRQPAAGRAFLPRPARRVLGLLRRSAHRSLPSLPRAFGAVVAIAATATPGKGRTRTSRCPGRTSRWELGRGAGAGRAAATVRS